MLHKLVMLINIVVLQHGGKTSVSSYITLISVQNHLHHSVRTIIASQIEFVAFPII